MLRSLRHAGCNAALGTVIGWCGPSCGGDDVFACVSDEQCAAGDGRDGRCESTGYCSFDDTSCESGRRYGSHATTGLAGACLPVDEGGSTGPTTSPPGTSGATGTSGDDGVSDTLPVGGSTTTGVSSTTSSSDGSGATDDTGDPACPDIFDDFEDGIVDPIWTAGIPEYVKEVGGELQLVVDASSSDYATLATAPMDLSQGWARAELGGALPDLIEVQVYLALYATGTGDYAIVLVEGSSLGARSGSEAGFEEYAYTPFDPNLHRWLQMRGAGGKLMFEVSGDGITFDTLAEADAPFDLSAVEIVLVAGNWGPIGSDTVVSFAEVQACTSPGP